MKFNHVLKHLLHYGGNRKPLKLATAIPLWQLSVADSQVSCACCMHAPVNNIQRQQDALKNCLSQSPVAAICCRCTGILRMLHACNSEQHNAGELGGGGGHTESLLTPITDAATFLTSSSRCVLYMCTSLEATLHNSSGSALKYSSPDICSAVGSCRSVEWV
jgi:hypothetical protein